MITDFNVLCPCIKDKIYGDRNNTNAITLELMVLTEEKHIDQIVAFESNSGG